MNNKETNRRSFIKLTAATATAIPTILVSQTSGAQDAVVAEKLMETDPLAIALGYKEVSAEVDATTYPNHSAEQICSDCTLYLGDDLESGGCSAFQNKLVTGGGWCAAWVAKSS